MSENEYVMPERQAREDVMNMVHSMWTDIESLLSNSPILQNEKYEHVRAALEAAQSKLIEVENLVGRTRLVE